MLNDTTNQALTVLRVQRGKSASGRPFKVSKTLDAHGNRLSDYELGYRFEFMRKRFTGWHDCRLHLDELASSKTDVLVLGEPVEWPMTRQARRLLHNQPNGDKATLRKGETVVLPFDFDGAVPPGVRDLDPVVDPEACVRAVIALLPDAFHDASVWWGLTSSQRPAPIAKLNLRLVFLLTTPWHLNEMKRLAGTLDKRLGADRSIYNGAQPIFLARPTIVGGDDPISRRFGFIAGSHDFVDPPPLPDHEIARWSGTSGNGLPLSLDEDPLRLIGDHDGGRGCYQGLRDAIWYLVLRRGKTLSDETIKEMLRQRVNDAEWDDERHAPAYRAAQITDEKLDSLIRGARDKLFAPQRLFCGIPPEYPAKTTSVQAATERLRECFHNVFAKVVLLGENVRLLVKAPAGLGKTTAILKEVINARLTAHLYVPTHTLAEEVAAKIHSLGATVQIIRGRTREDGDPDFPVRMCEKADLVTLLQSKGIANIQSHLCIRTYTVDGDRKTMTCPSFGVCGYAHQFKVRAQVTIYTHRSLGIDRNIFEQDAPKPDIAIIDEDPLQSLIHRQAWSISDARNAGGVVAEIAGITVSGLDLLATLRERYPDAKETVQEAIDAIETERLPITPALDTEVALTLLRGAEAPVTFLPLLETVRDALGSGEDRFNGVWLGTDKNKAESIHLARLRPPVRIDDRDSNFVILDATPNVSAWRAVLPDLEIEEIQAERNAVVVQIFDRTVSKSSLSDEQRGKARVEDLVGFGAAAAEHYGSVGVCGPKLVIDAMRVALPELIKEGKLKVAHFGALRGIDELKNCTLGIVIGRNMPTAFDVEERARAIWPFAEMHLPGQFIRRHYGYRMRDGEQLGVVTLDHEDPRVSSELRSIREAESEQAIDRHRLLHRAKPKLIFVLSDLPLDLDVDHLVEFEDIVGRPGLASKLHKFDGVLPLGATWLTQRAGFESEKSAENWVRKVLQSRPVLRSNPSNPCKSAPGKAQNPQPPIRPSGDQNPQSSMYIYRELRVLAWRVVEYRLKGESGRARKAVTYLTSLARIRNGLASLHGADVTGLFWAKGQIPATLLADGDPVSPIQDCWYLPALLFAPMQGIWRTGGRGNVHLTRPRTR